MKACGIVVEYNPLHYGHVYHIQKSKEITKCDILIAVMSGNWTQRGEPALVGKDIRTLAALENGVDLVVELPFAFGVNSADYFAQGAIDILASLQVQDIVFGSETGDTEAFQAKYQIHPLSYPRMDDLTREYLDQGYSYPKARSLAEFEVHHFYLETPNDILANAYVRVIQNQKYPISYHSILRTSTYKDEDTQNENASARAIRKALLEEKEIVNMTPMATHIQNTKTHTLEDYFPLLRYILLATPKEELQKIHLISEGIESLFIKNITKVETMSAFIQSCTSKRYSGARITRMITHVLNHSSKEQFASLLQEKIPYVRILGMNDKGRKYLSSIRKDCEVPLLSRFQGKEHPMLQLEKKATATYLATLPSETFIKEFEKEISLYPIYYPLTNQKEESSY